jgi:BMFP domain-containing protein YqiC
MKRKRNIGTNTISANRANEFSIRRLFKSSLEKLKTNLPETKEKIEKELEIVKQNILDVNNSIDLNAFHKLQQLETNLSNLENDLNVISTHVKTQENQFSQLKNFECVQSLVFANRLLEKPPEVYPYDSDKCSGCNTVFIFNATDSMNICTICNVSVPVLFQSEDTSADTLILRCIVSGTALEKTTGLVPLPSKTVNIANKSASRIPFYKKFLQQYSTKIPIDVFLYLHRCHVSTIHIPNIASCRSTIVAVCLKESPIFAKYEKLSMRITNELCGASSPILNDELIEKLVERFKDFMISSNDVLSAEQSKKNACFEFMTNRFLILENKKKLSRMFNLPKTRTVLRECDKRFQIVSKALGWKIKKAI